MTAVFEEVKAAAPALSAGEQLELIEYLETSSLEELDSIHLAWKAESRRRFAELESSGVEGIPLKDVFARRSSQ